MKREKGEKKTYAKPRMEELDDRRSRDLVGLGLFICFCRALENNSTEEMERIHKELDELGLTIKKNRGRELPPDEEGGEVMFHERKEMPINPWVYEEVRREDGSLMTARIYTSDDARECFICEDEAMLPQMMRDFWTSVGRRDIKCE